MGQESAAAPGAGTLLSPAIPAAQAKTTAGIAAYLNSHFQTPQQKIQALYGWLAANITYDVQALASMPRYYEKQALITQTLATRKALCQGYAEVFQEVCARMGIPAYLVTGFVVPKGTSTQVGHAWGAAQIEGQWYLFDPTWGAGYMEEGAFVSRPNTRYFMVAPATMIQTHIPFDPLWQFSQRPLSYQEFLSAKAGVARPTAVRPSPVFSFRDSLAAYEASSHRKRLEGTIRRISAHKVIPPVVLDHLNLTRKNLAINKQNETVDLYNEAARAFNTGMDQLNEFIRYRNNRFLPVTSDQELKQMTRQCASSFLQTKRLLQQVKPTDNTDLFLTTQHMKAQVEKALLLVEKQEVFLARYFKTPPKERPALFFRPSRPE
ncbi:hypothetical protein GCM10011405_33110 [Rufibacter glacialis]|nr:hypothetical protein GCM10011405_33110 [Rufibacter glacialis]